jgi:hypothetical protein
MIDIISKIIGGILYLLIIGGIAYFGVFSLQGDMDFIGCLCLGIAIKGLIQPIIEYLGKSREKRQVFLRKIYNIPERLDHEYGEVWDNEFQKVIKKAIDTTTDASKLSDLQECQRVAQQMIKDSSSYTLDRPYYKINNAFRLTGCHFTITDSEGKTITQIV